MPYQYDCCSRQSALKQNLYKKAFIDGLIDNNEKVAYSKKKHTSFKTSVPKPYPITGLK